MSAYFIFSPGCGDVLNRIILAINQISRRKRLCLPYRVPAEIRRDVQPALEFQVKLADGTLFSSGV
jgi:hypothetical protein